MQFGRGSDQLIALSRWRQKYSKSADKTAHSLFDPTPGPVHTHERYRPSLSSDLMDPVRPVADRIHRGHLESGEEEKAAGFEVRKQLRGERKRLVGRLHHLTGEDYPDINARINGACGFVKVDEAKVDQLERSVDLLNREINKHAVSSNGGLSAFAPTVG